MPDLAAPAELLDLTNEGQLVTRVVRWEQGPMTIKPPRAPGGVTIQVTRLHVPPEDKPHAPAYWDVTAQTIQPTLAAMLPTVVGGRWLRIVKHGVAPRARFSVDVLPPGFAGPAHVDQAPR